MTIYKHTCGRQIGADGFCYACLADERGWARELDAVDKLAVVEAERDALKAEIVGEGDRFKLILDKLELLSNRIESLESENQDLKYEISSLRVGLGWDDDR